MNEIVIQSIAQARREFPIKCYPLTTWTSSSSLIASVRRASPGGFGSSGFEVLTRHAPIRGRLSLVLERSHVVLDHPFDVHTVGPMVNLAVINTNEPTIS